MTGEDSAAGQPVGRAAEQAGHGEPVTPGGQPAGEPVTPGGQHQEPREAAQPAGEPPAPGWEPAPPVGSAEPARATGEYREPGEAAEPATVAEASWMPAPGSEPALPEQPAPWYATGQDPPEQGTPGHWASRQEASGYGAGGHGAGGHGLPARQPGYGLAGGEPGYGPAGGEPGYGLAGGEPGYGPAGGYPSWGPAPAGFGPYGPYAQGIQYGPYGQDGPYGQPSGAGQWLPPGGYGPAGYGRPGGYGGPGGPGRWGPPPGGQGQPGGYGKPRRLARFLLYGVVAALAAGAGATAAALALHASSGPGVSPQQIPQIPSGNGPGSLPDTSAINVRAVASRVEPGVVDITSRLRYTGQVFEGTGMVLSPSGLVLTNNPVVNGSTKLVVTLVTNGRRYSASVVGTDAKDDVALLKLQGAAGLKTVTVGNSGKVSLGMPVVAIGNAGGAGGSPTVTSGTITALNRTITASDSGSNTSETLHGMLQTNAPIAEGDSGGPLANSAGQVIGMDTAANTQNLGGPGTAQGFAIPINKALAIARQMAAGHGNGNIRIGLPPFMGIAVASMPASAPGASPQQQLRQLQQVALRFGGGVDSTGTCLQGSAGNPVPSQVAPVPSGTLVAGAFCNAPAYRAGLTGGDVITAVNGHPVHAPSSLTSILSRYRPGNTISVTWVDVNGNQHTGSLTLIAGPAK
jgi:S1-C subfamily serine protease